VFAGSPDSSSGTMDFTSIIGSLLLLQ